MNPFKELIHKEKKILIFGKHGQLGKAFRLGFGTNENILQLSKEDVNFLKPNIILSIVNDFKPHYIINTSAYTNVNEAELNPKQAFAINSEALKIIAEATKKNNSILIHYSTDYIFDGTKKTIYKPYDIPNPKNIYGKSKLAGEQNILKSGCNFFIFRISWLISEYGINFIKTIMSKIKNKDPLFIVDDQIGSPISSNLVANITAEILSSIYNQESNKIFHLSTKGKVSWYDIALHISSVICKTNINSNITPVKTNEYPSKAFRPKNSLFDHSDIEITLRKKMPYWKDDITPIIVRLNAL